MGKGTETLDQLMARPLSGAEIAEREAALAAGGQGEATLNGTLVKRRTPTESGREVAKASKQTWD